MPFDIDLKPTFIRKVKATIPQGKSSIEQTFNATFEALDIPTFNSFDITTPEGADKFLQRVFVGADDLVNSGGHPVEFTLDVKAKLIALPWARTAIIEAYLSGFNKAAEGN